MQLMYFIAAVISDDLELMGGVEKSSKYNTPIGGFPVGADGSQLKVTGFWTISAIL